LLSRRFSGISFAPAPPVPVPGGNRQEKAETGVYDLCHQRSASDPADPGPPIARHLRDLFQGKSYHLRQMSTTGDAMKKLYRSTTDRWIAGVCGGIGEYVGIDPNVIRVIWAIITAITGFLAGIIAYILVWVILPEQEQAQPAEAPIET
jgi:phage shock protein C